MYDAAIMLSYKYDGSKHFFLWWSIKFMQQNINQSETGIGDKKLSVKLYASFHLLDWSKDILN